MATDQAFTTEEDRTDDGHGRVGRLLPRRGGSLTLAFESGRPVSAAPIDLGDADAVVLGRASGRPGVELQVQGGERRLSCAIDDRRMSRAHAQLRPLEGGWQLDDAGSRNGTRVN